VAADVVTLRAGTLEARFVPGVGMVGASLRHHGRELLGRRDGLDAYASRGSTFGIPLLHPWANRLGGFTYRAAGRDVVLRAGQPGLRTEEHGLPIHGVLAASPRWEVAERDERRLSARLDYDAPELLEVFPFVHRLSIDVTLTGDALTVTTTLTATGEHEVPVSFGWHPYLQLPGVAREDVVMRTPAMSHLSLDGLGLPTGAEAPVPARDQPLGDAAVDDLFGDLPEPLAVSLTGGPRQVTVRFVEGYTHLQLFAPPGRPFIAVEPMTAPTDALRSGRGLRLVPPGAPFRATFMIEIADL
jgi:galactose mutarotase-like enzyme